MELEKEDKAAAIYYVTLT